MAYVILKIDYVEGGDTNFSGYIDYMDRDSAKENSYKDDYAFKGFVDYMERDSAKGSGLFSDDGYNLSFEEVDKRKELFNYVDKNGNFMWRFTFSFEEGFLEKLGIKGEGFIREDILKDITRKAMSSAIDKGKFLENSWVGEIHHNTENTHIHVALIDPSSSKERGFISGINKVAKSVMANELMHFDDPLIKERQARITEIIREEIIPARRNSQTELLSRASERELFIEIFSRLPEDRRKWHYNMNSISSIRPLLDEYTNRFLEKNFKGEIEDLIELLTEQGEVHSSYYGGGEIYKNIYVENKIQDLYSRLGNVVLNEMRDLNYGLSLSNSSYLSRGKGSSLVELFSDDSLKKLQREIDINLMELSKDYLGRTNFLKMKARLEKGG